MYSEEIKKGMEAKKMSLQDVVNDLKQYHDTTTSPQNIHRYATKGMVKRPDFILLEKIFNVLGLDASKLPQNKDERKDDIKSSMDTYLENLQKENVELKDEVMKLTKELLSFYRKSQSVA